MAAPDGGSGSASSRQGPERQQWRLTIMENGKRGFRRAGMAEPLSDTAPQGPLTSLTAEPGRTAPDGVSRAASPPAGPTAQAESEIPACNEERALASGVRSLAACLRAGFPFRARITIPDNGSFDRAQEVAEAPTGGLPGLGTRPAPRFPAQLLRFACIGVASTVAYALLYLAFRGMGMTAQAANAVSLLLTAFANTAANRRITFGVRGRAHAGRHQVQGLIAFAAGLVVTSAALATLHAVSARPARIIEVSVLVTATLVATIVRFALYTCWVFRPGRSHWSGP
jgi:putative flippase GtrA